MNLDDQHDLDALLRRWPAPPPSGDEPDEEKRWDHRADATVRAAVESTRHGGPDDGLDALLAAPVLAPEPGESAATFRSGDKPHAEPTPVPKTIPPADRKRGSLKEIAARASQSGTRPNPVGTPVPASNPTPIPMAIGRPSRPPMSTPVPASSRPLSRPPEAGKEDSGVVNLHEVNAAATPAQIAAADKAKPGQVGIFDEHTVESAINSAEQPAPARPTHVTVIAARSKSRSGPIAGAAIALLGIAAAFAIMHRKPPETAPTAPVIAAHTAAPAVVAKQAPSTAPKATTGPAPLDVDALPNADEGKPSDTARVAAGASPGAAATAGAATTASKDAPADPRLATKGSADKPADLASAMAPAVGPVDKPGAEVPAPRPASDDNRNQNIPEQPSQGSVQSAIGAVIGGAKACVAGADDISRATVTFTSAGTVSSVSVSGWAAAHGKSGCIEAALKAAKVGAFSKPSYSVPVPIRP